MVYTVIKRFLQQVKEGVSHGKVCGRLEEIGARRVENPLAVETRGDEPATLTGSVELLKRRLLII